MSGLLGTFCIKWAAFLGRHKTDIQSIRTQIPALQSCTYLNCGTFGPTPSVVAEEAIRLTRLIEHKGPYDRDVNEEILTLFEDSRKSFASYIGASSDEIALTRNVSDGINIVALSLIHI